ncbi:hypothetical protein BGZ95_011551 [Linnemannia exigua]|uniref:Crinkler effector protein N-terminal domain-containing protein n=1 Tax=Linnemannia exigua TaxID=604196 RepID=A0AAD4D9X7_9FUNG|nr:hypothetical protein BGZ95_011551 [Linnemannia exigua]
MDNNPLTLFCLVDGEATSQAFSIDIDQTKTVDHLKDLIKTKKTNNFSDVDADQLTLWRVSIPDDDDNDLPVLFDSVPEKKKLKATTRLLKVFDTELPDDTIHIIVQRPPQVHALVPAPLHARSSTPLSDDSRPGTPPTGDLRVDINRIRHKFFAAGSKHAEFLDSYVQGQYSLSVTTEGVRGLPKVLRRGIVNKQEARPNLLFLDLPNPPSSVAAPVPERFKSNVLLDVLENMQAQDLPVFGVSGCGKTRSMIEMLCLQWGFYFNAAKSDFGSDDLFRLAELIDNNTLEDATGTNTVFAKNMTLLLFLSRLMILDYCLKVPGCRQTFTSARWALLQVCPNTFKDVFVHLCMKLCDLTTARTVPVSDLASIVRKEFESVREILAVHDYPNFSSDSKLRVVIDEAQILSDKSPTSFASSSTQGNLRPMLSPVLHAFRLVGLRDELTIIYSGTGLSIQTLHWAMSSGDGIKEYGSSTFPYIEFPGCAGSVQAYVDRLKEQLPEDESKAIVDTLVPSAAVEMLHKRLTGRFRPIVTAIEGILETGRWDTAIDRTETMITSWKDRERRGNLCGELKRLESKIADHPEFFTSCSSIRETLGLFLFRHHLLDAPSTVLENDFQLVEAAFGRIKLFGGAARTVLDEPLALKATINYFQEKDPSLVAAAERAMLHSDNPSHFMKAHVENNSKLGDQSIPPFYFPAPYVSGPDIVFYVKINGNVYPVFVQLKLRQVLEKSDVEKALGTVSSHAVQKKMDKEQEKIEEEQKKFDKEQKKRQKQGQQKSTTSIPSDQHQPPQLQNYCPSGIYISMVITYPAEVVNFQVVRPDPEPELEGLQRVSIGIDDNNFPKIFPRRHVDFLDKLKGHKRRSEEQQSQKSKKKKANDPLQCDEQ